MEGQYFYSGNMKGLDEALKGRRWTARAGTTRDGVDSERAESGEVGMTYEKVTSVGG